MQPRRRSDMAMSESFGNFHNNFRELCERVSCTNTLVGDGDGDGEATKKLCLQEQVRRNRHPDADSFLQQAIAVFFERLEFDANHIGLTLFLDRIEKHRDDVAFPGDEPFARHCRKIDDLLAIGAGFR